MEQKNGRGIFLGVIGVATLVVAIIGATFAYFSASATNNTTIQGQTAQAGGLTLAVTELVGDGTGLIPLNLVDGDSQLAAALGDTQGSVCQDSNNSNVCAIYKIAITNDSATNAIGINGKLNLASTATNMKWAVLNGAGINEESDIETVTGTTFNAIDTVIAQATDSYIEADETSNTTLDGGATNYYYVLVWLEETGVAQEDDDASDSETTRTYTGTVTFNAVASDGSTSGVTATFN